MAFRHGVVILHNKPRADAGLAPEWREADAGVMAEVEAVAQAFEQIELPYRRAGIRRLQDIGKVLTPKSERLVFNLVESLAGEPADAAAVPSVCRAMGLACTGADTACQTLCQDKWTAKAALQAYGVPTPAAAVVPLDAPVPAAGLPEGRLIVKPLRADASEGIDDAAVIPESRAGLDAAVRRVHAQFRQPALVEQFVEGREFNVALLQREGRVSVLPLAEIEFAGFPGDKPRIVSYAAKWKPDSFESRNTPRRVPAALPEELAERLRRLALMAWEATGCQDYARVDFRVDASGRPFALDVNPNPDVSAEAGFAAALAAGGVTFAQFAQAMLQNAAARLPGRSAAAGPTLGGAAGAPELALRRSVPEDGEALLRLLLGTRSFRPDEMAVAQEVAVDALASGAEGHYQAFTALVEGRVAGWICFGATPCAPGTFDIYWIAVDRELQRRGIGAALLAHAERLMAESGGRMAVLETSSRPAYERTRQFYLKHGYAQQARVPDFYAPGDDKMLFTKAL